MARLTNCVKRVTHVVQERAAVVRCFIEEHDAERWRLTLTRENGRVQEFTPTRDEVRLLAASLQRFLARTGCGNCGHTRASHDDGAGCTVDRCGSICGCSRFAEPREPGGRA